MEWFKKKKEVSKFESSKLPELPELPKLPELPSIKNEAIHKLPSFPNNSLGYKFSQNTIKGAITGKKEENESYSDADESVYTESDIPKMQMPPEEFYDDEEPDLRESRTEKISRTNLSRSVELSGKKRETEPLFIRVDKFEESLHVLDGAKEKINKVEKMLSDIKKIKEEESKELSYWENEMQKVKKQIEKIDQELFSKI